MDKLHGDRLYLWSELRELKKKEIRFCYDFYIDNITTIFKDLDLENNIDICEMKSLMKYRYLAFNITLLHQLWEQQTINFIQKEIENDGYKFDGGMNIKDIKEIFKLYGLDITMLESWNTLEELRLVSNVIKHGEGWAAKNLRKIRPDIFEVEIDYRSKYFYDKLKTYKSTLLEETLNIKVNDFERYKNGIIKFWDELPEFLYIV